MLDSPKLQFLDNIAGFSIYEVDGDLIRESDPDFQVGGQPYRYSFIPSDELWIDKNFDMNDTQYLIDYLLEEYILMFDGKSYTEAARNAEHVMNRERSRSLDLYGYNVPKNQADYFHKEIYGNATNVKVWIVDSFRVITLLDENFFESGNDRIYRYIPIEEIWIADDIDRNELNYVLLHELHERALMLNYRFPYDLAHRQSIELEFAARKNPGMLTKYLQAEGWEFNNPYNLDKVSIQ